MFSVQRAVWETARAISDIDLHVGSSTGGGCEWLDLPAERVAVHGFNGSRFTENPPAIRRAGQNGLGPKFRVSFTWCWINLSFRICMIVLDALALPVVVSSPHTSGGLAYKHGQRKKDNTEP